MSFINNGFSEGSWEKSACGDIFAKYVASYMFRNTFNVNWPVSGTLS